MVVSVSPRGSALMIFSLPCDLFQTNSDKEGIDLELRFRGHFGDNPMCMLWRTQSNFFPYLGFLEIPGGKTARVMNAPEM